jgi:hypothetical protein
MVIPDGSRDDALRALADVMQAVLVVGEGLEQTPPIEIVHRADYGRVAAGIGPGNNLPRRTSRSWHVGAGGNLISGQCS